MVDWQVTAKTLYCDAVNDEVTVIIKKDWSIQCTGCSGQSNCEGPECRRTVQYKEQLLNEEKHGAG